MTFVNETINKSTEKIIQTEKTDDELKTLIHEYIKKIGKKHKIHPKKIYFRNMKTKWASCSSKKNLMFNTKMKYLPDDLIKYIVLHETIHIIERKHNRRFWKIISRSFSNYEKKEKDLFLYWFLTQNKKLSKNYK
jgi:predicted metal-dependent hydrolase